MINHLVQIFLVSLARHLGMACLGSSRLGTPSAVGRMAQNAIQVTVTPFDDVASLVVCEEKGAEFDSSWT